MSSDDQIEMMMSFRGEVVNDLRGVYWARSGGEAHWPDGNGDTVEQAPWPYPACRPGEDEPDFEACFTKHLGPTAFAYAAYIEGEETRPEGLLLRHDPQLGGGMEWLLLDPAKEVTP